MLVIIDMQNEYVHERGMSTVSGAKDLEKGILEKIEEYEEKKDFILYTINTKVTHNRNEQDAEWAITPYGKLKEALRNHYLIKKTNYAITAKQAMEINNNIMGDVDVRTIEFVGVETNICVISNGIVFQNLFPDAKIIINSRLCASSDQLLGHKALDVMRELKMEVI